MCWSTVDDRLLGSMFNLFDIKLLKGKFSSSILGMNMPGCNVSLEANKETLAIERRIFYSNLRTKLLVCIWWCQRVCGFYNVVDHSVCRCMTVYTVCIFHTVQLCLVFGLLAVCVGFPNVFLFLWVVLNIQSGSKSFYKLGGRILSFKKRKMK